MMIRLLISQKTDSPAIRTTKISNCRSGIPASFNPTATISLSGKSLHIAERAIIIKFTF